MTEKEKIIEILKHEKDEFIEEEYHGYITRVDSEKLADALIENGIGDVAEWKEKYAKLEKSDTSKENCTIEQHEEIHYLRDKLKQTQKECDEWKARANDWKQRFESRDKQCNEQKIAGCEALQLKAEVAEKIAKKACDIVFSQEIDGEDWENVICLYKEENEKYYDEIGITEDMLYDYLKEQTRKKSRRKGNERLYM